MPVNAHPEYLAAEKEYLIASTMEEKIKCLEKMISLAPSHKSAENLRAELKTRLKRLRGKLEKIKFRKKAGRKAGIRKEDMQTVIIGFTNSGKSSLLDILTNANPEISPNEEVKFTTREPQVAMMPYSGVQIQMIENPAFESEYYDKGLTNSADALLIIINDLGQIKKMEEELQNSTKKRLIVFNKVDKLTEQEKRKLSATLQSKKYNFTLISTKTGQGIEELKEKIFQSFDKIRVYTKEPGKEKSKKPVILKPNSTVRDVAEKILKGFSEKIKETKIWGPSSKFPGQKVGLQHKLKDMDVVEFKTK
jgi:hypothetical protein